MGDSVPGPGRAAVLVLAVVVAAAILPAAGQAAGGPRDLTLRLSDLTPGYSYPPQRCRARAPDRYLAHVFLDGLVVSVNVPICSLCVDDADRPDPYDTLAGMRAVVEGLQPRPLSRPAHAPAPAGRPR